ncbi:uncharacterized protein Nmag_3356 [Natrialba magadii ATCC 43099]|uniref:Uncharacterized protein n=2 Tax=Natrialba magadii (strain ATCC 43099 / DSM 3394 / CCM 3739 / CIP 104546 / IAM 13178 / JCM 8861 / NBRC 102185 / NCIMB 2190 / MS3) TaxID=547559 RepID=D3SSR1_NATMM|nr:hypothetical protein [Natrialba magadii]ADD06906.1 uncharacterized protein Nmag_3356 [Natrialba magadii ATCC 43099]
MTNTEPPVPESVLTSARERLEQEELTLADNEAILHSLSELTPVYENERSYFVLGSYDREPIRRLNLVVDRLNRRPDAYAFRMVDVRGEWENGIQKFCLIADLVTHVVGIAEKEPSDFLVEQGLLAGTTEFFEKSYVLKREYPDTEEDHPFGWMQDGVFELLESEGRLHRWETEADLTEAAEKLP